MLNPHSPLSTPLRIIEEQQQQQHDECSRQEQPGHMSNRQEASQWLFSETAG